MDADTRASMVWTFDIGMSGSTCRIRPRSEGSRVVMGSCSARITRYMVVVPSEPCANGA